jgi:hypothetical protein
MQVGDRGRTTHTVSLRYLIEPNAVLPVAVEVLVRFQARLLGRLQPGARQLVSRAAVTYGERATRGVKF